MTIRARNRAYRSERPRGVKAFKKTNEDTDGDPTGGGVAAYDESAGDPSIDVVCDIPMYDKLQVSNWYTYWQTFHGRKTANGYLAHHSEDATPLLERIKRWGEIGIREIIELRAMGIDAIVYHQPGHPTQLIRLDEVEDGVVLSSR